MRIFITGASGWIGSAAVDELLAGGHQVVGLARSDASAAALVAKGAEVHRGDLDDPDALRAGAADAEAVLHLANKHDFVRPEVSNAAERGAVQALGEVLAGSDRPFMVASGVAGLTRGRPSTEQDRSPAVGPESMRGGSENLALDFAQKGVRTLIARFSPTTHGTGDHGFVAALVGVARERGVSAYIGDGDHRWAAAHVTDTARLIRIGLEQGDTGTILHAVAEEGVPTRQIAEAIGAGLGVPVTSIAPADAGDHFGWIGRFFGLDLASSSAVTRERFGWTPTGPTLLEDLGSGAYGF